MDFIGNSISLLILETLVNFYLWTSCNKF